MRHALLVIGAALLAYVTLSCVGSSEVRQSPADTPLPPDSTAALPPTDTTTELPAVQTAYTCDGPSANVTFSWPPTGEEGAAGDVWLDMTALSSFEGQATASEGPVALDAGSYEWQGVVANVRQHYRLRTMGANGWLAGETGTLFARCEYLAQVPCGDVLVPLNKQHHLPADCKPPDLVLLPSNLALGDQLLRREASEAFLALLGEAEQEGHILAAASAYRSYSTQETLFNSYAQSSGVEQAERFSARPGQSEHQLGTTVDVTSSSVNFDLSRSFAGTPEGAWLAENAWRFGFVISYPEGLEDVTGYTFEPWHLRFVGADIAGEVRDGGLTLTEMLLLRWY